MEAALPSAINESPEHHAVIRAAIEQALREFISLSLPITGKPQREHFVSYLQGRFELDEALVAKLPLQVAA